MGATDSAEQPAAFTAQERRLASVLRGPAAFFLGGILFNAIPPLRALSPLFAHLPFVTNSAVKMGGLGLLALFAAGDVRRYRPLILIILGAHVLSELAVLAMLLVRRHERGGRSAQKAGDDSQHTVGVGGARCGAAERQPPAASVECTSSRLAPIGDTVGAVVLLAISGLAALCPEIRTTKVMNRGRLARGIARGGRRNAGTTGYTASAAYGYWVTSRCDDALGAARSVSRQIAAGIARARTTGP